HPPPPTRFPYTTLFRSVNRGVAGGPTTTRTLSTVRIAAMDLGTNSFHLLVADASPDGAIVPLVREKEMLGLGHAVGRAGRISESDRKSTRLNSSHVAIS